MAGHPSAVPSAPTRRYVLGAGRVYIAPLTAAGILGGERYLGSSPGFTLSVTNEQTEVFDDDGPIAEKVVQVVRQVAHAFSLQCKNVSPENLALFTGGDALDQDDTATPMDADPDADPPLANARDKIVVDAKDRFFKLGIYPVTTTTPARTAKPAGVRAIATGVVVNKGTHGGAAAAAGTDFVVDAAHGRIYIPAGSTIATGSTIYVTYTPVAGTDIARVDFSEPQQVRGAIRYIEDSANKNVPAGNYGWEMYAPLCTIAPSGEMAVKSRENPQVIGLDVAIQEPSAGPSFTMLQQAS